MGKYDFTIRTLRRTIAVLMDEQCHINNPDLGKQMKEVSSVIDLLDNMREGDPDNSKPANCGIFNVTHRYLFIYVDGDYKLIQYVEAENQEAAEDKMEEGWVRIVELFEDLQIVYNGR